MSLEILLEYPARTCTLCEHTQASEGGTGLLNRKIALRWILPATSGRFILLNNTNKQTTDPDTDVKSIFSQCRLQKYTQHTSCVPIMGVGQNRHLQKLLSYLQFTGPPQYYEQTKRSPAYCHLFNYEKTSKGHNASSGDTAFSLSVLCFLCVCVFFECF